jgi:hypothetical protein
MKAPVLPESAINDGAQYINDPMFAPLLRAVLIQEKFWDEDRTDEVLAHYLPLFRARSLN